MLSYAYQALNEDGFRNVVTEDFKNIHDLMSAILIRGVTNQIKRGLHRNYISQTETLGNLRGKIDMTSSVKQQTMLTRRMVCTYDLFSEDTLLNSILKTTLRLLIRHGDVKQENKKTLRKLLIYFGSVTDIDPFQINWSAISYHRNNATYKILINICWLTIKGLLSSTTDGKYKMAQFIDDQTMHRLYEKFVLNYFKKEFPQYAPSAKYINWNVDDGIIDFLPTMKSDITLTCGDKKLIIDTKYYSLSMQTNTMYNSTTIISNNLYQIFTYVKNADRMGSGNVSGVLLYAKTDEILTPNNDYQIGGNRISVKTLDLNKDFSEIKLQLNGLVEGYL
jgi:5-methylcytosine-specific restriction enzyme subunit McrC